jgi:hypothetical protein
MKKRNLPTGINRKRWIERLSDEEYNNLPKEDQDNLRKFQNFSYLREQKTQTIKILKEKIKDLKKEIFDLDGTEESNFIKVQHLHNVMGCRIEITRQKKTPKSIKVTHSYGGVWSGDFSKGNVSGVLHSDFNKRKTYGGDKLKESFIYHGKIISKNLSKPKSCYFQNEKGMFLTIKELKGVDISKSKNPLKEVKNQLIPSYKDYVMILMRELGMKKFETHKVKFSDFIDWYKINRMKKQGTI